MQVGARGRSRARGRGHWTSLAPWQRKVVGTARLSHGLHLWGVAKEENYSVPSGGAMLQGMGAPGPTCKPALTQKQDPQEEMPRPVWP